MTTSGSFTPPAIPECPYAPRMTRAAAIALRTAGSLKENCVVVITDGPVIGTAGNTSPTEIELNPVSPTELGTTARVHTTFAASAWHGVYDIDLGTAGSITELTDDWGNTAKDIDADSATVHTQFPWHLGSTTFRDNYVEDSVLTGWDVATFVTNNRVIESTFDLTGKTSGTVNESEVIASTVKSGGAFFSFNQNKARASTLDFGAGVATGTVSITRCDLDSAVVTRDPTATGGMSWVNSQVDTGTFIQGAASTGSVNLTASQLANSNVNVDPNSAKGFSASNSELFGFTVRTQDAGGLGSVTISNSNCVGKPNPATADSVLIRGATGNSGISITNTFMDGFSAAPAGSASIDVNASASSHIISDSIVQNSRINVGPGAGAFQVANGSTFRSAIVNANSATGGRLTIGGSTINGATVNHAAASTNNLQVQNCRIEAGGLVELLSGGRDLNVSGCDVIDGIIRQSTVNAASVPNSNSVNDTVVRDLGRIVFSETTPAGQTGSSVLRSLVQGNSLGGGVDGMLTITGNSAFVVVDRVKVEGIVTLTDVPSGALAAGTSFHDLRVGPASTLTYTAGDATAKQIRNIEVSGLSTLTLSALTGSAGAGLADVFGMYVRGQSTVTVTGARVAGQPVRDTTVEQGSVLNVAASGSVQRCRVAGGATLNTGAFVHFDTEMSLAATKTLTAANVNRLCNKSYDDCL